MLIEHVLFIWIKSNSVQANACNIEHFFLSFNQLLNNTPITFKLYFLLNFSSVNAVFKNFRSKQYYVFFFSFFLFFTFFFVSPHISKTIGHLQTVSYLLTVSVNFNICYFCSNVCSVYVLQTKFLLYCLWLHLTFLSLIIVAKQETFCYISKFYKKKVFAIFSFYWFLIFIIALDLLRKLKFRINKQSFVTYFLQFTSSRLH